jgi:tetratricopeptide (TPR) repeat protein
MDWSPRRPSRARRHGAALLCGALLLLAGAPGCGRRAAEKAARPESSEAQPEWAWLQRTKTDLDARRARLAAQPDPRLQKETQALADELNRRLAAFLNSDPPIQGEPLSERQKAALRMKSDEEIHLARAWIEQGGDFQRAIDIYKEALVVDPDNPRLKEELAQAEGRRYMKRETFAQVQKGMEPDEVRHLLGAPNLNNVRSYPERGVTGWFYPRNAGGDAAAVWFHKEDGRTVVYLTDFDALHPPAAAPAPAPRSAA